MADEMRKRKVVVYMRQAYHMLEVAEHNFASNYFETVINRSYYAVFYAATALLITIDVTRSKHRGVMSAFRRHFVKSGVWDEIYSDIYGQLIHDRESSDYVISVVRTQANAEVNLKNARFVDRTEDWLLKEGWL